MIFNVFMLKLDEQTFWVSPSGQCTYPHYLHPTIYKPRRRVWDLKGSHTKWPTLLQQTAALSAVFMFYSKCDMFLHFRESSEEFPEKPDDNLFAL